MTSDPTTIPAPFGEVLRRLRLKAGLTQEALAERAGLSARGLSDLERGVRAAPRRDTLHLLVAALALVPSDRVALEQAARQSAAAIRATVARGRTTRPSSWQFPGAKLPLQAAEPLVGRETDIAAIATMVREPGARLVTLTGPGGVGKTRLALRVASNLEADFPDGVVFVPLAAIRDPDLVLPTVAEALGVREVTGRALQDALRSALDERRVLLVLDNFEQILAGAAAIGRLLGASPTLQILATSRAPLQLGSEHRYPVLPLAVPEPTAGMGRDELASNPAVQLFVRRARQVRPHFALTSDNGPDVAAICRRLDGLPLAIELAAARITVLPPSSLLARLERALPLLSGGVRDLPGRLQTMRDAIGWSFDLLSPQDQILFRRLAIFEGGFTLQAAEAVVPSGADLEEAVFDGIVGLVENSLVQPAERSGDEPRFGMLETIREYGRDQVAGDDEGALRDRHATYFLEFAERAAPAIHGPEQRWWRTHLGDEMANLRLALAWFDQTEQVDAMLRMIGFLGDVWVHRGHLREGYEWAERALAKGGSVSPRIAALFSAAIMSFIAGDIAQSVAWTHEALRLVAESGDARLEGRLLYNVVTTAWMQGDLELARSRAEHAITRLREENDRTWLAWALCDIGTAMYIAGETDFATRLSEEGLALHRALGNATGVATKLMDDGAVAHAAGDTATAAAAYAESLEIWRDFGDSWWSASPLAGAAALACTLGRFPLAARLLGASARLRESSGSQTLPHERARDEMAVIDAKLHLGEEAYARHFAIGQRLLPEEAIAEALDVTTIVISRASGIAASQGLPDSQRSESSMH